MNLSTLTHPEYDAESIYWFKWRLAYEGGIRFVDQYLRKLSIREDITDFNERKSITYSPSFAKAAINDIKNAIFQRTTDVVRKNGPESYQKAIESLNLGVDLQGSSMNSFIGRIILPELLVMGCVGVYIDMPPLNGPTLADNIALHPYLYCFKKENIRSWKYSLDGELIAIVLRQYNYQEDPIYDLPMGYEERYRYIWKQNNSVYTQYYNSVGKEISEVIQLNLKRIPFVQFKITESLMKDVADIQVALLNIASSDISYILKSNYPFYVEQYDPRFEQAFTKHPESEEVSKTKEIRVGVGQGRRVPIGTAMPEFINPSSETLTASMEKQRELKAEIRQLVNLAVANLDAQRASAESKEFDNQGLEAGLSYIGLVLENGERQIAEHWAAYEKSLPATVSYPNNYTLKSESDRQEEVEGDDKILMKIPSGIFKREMAKKIVKTKLCGKVPYEVLEKIYNEIDSAEAIVSDPVQIHQDWEDGFVSTKTASGLRGYVAEEEVPQAALDRAERIKLVQLAQGGEDGQARGDNDTQTTQPTSIEEKNKSN